MWFSVCFVPALAPLRALVPLNFLRVQNLTAVSPSGLPAVVTARLECINSPHLVIGLLPMRAAGSFRVLPIVSGFSR